MISGHGGHLSPEKGQLRVQTRSRWRSWVASVAYKPFVFKKYSMGFSIPLRQGCQGSQPGSLLRSDPETNPCYRHLQIFDITPHTQHEQHKQLPKKNQLNPSVFFVGILLVPFKRPHWVGLWPCISLAKHDCHLSVPMKLPRSGSRLRFHLSRGEQCCNVMNGQPTLPYPPPGVTCPPLQKIAK